MAPRACTLADSGLHGLRCLVRASGASSEGGRGRPFESVCLPLHLIVAPKLGNTLLIGLGALQLSYGRDAIRAIRETIYTLGARHRTTGASLHIDG